MTANETRGEISLDLCGTEYVLRPSYEAIQAIEQKLGRGLLALARVGGEGNLTLHETAVIACECIRAYGRAIDDKMLSASSSERIAELIYETEHGQAGVMGRLAMLMGLAATGGYDKSGELRPAKAGPAATE